jgi:hypothetical protein
MLQLLALLQSHEITQTPPISNAKTSSPRHRSSIVILRQATASGKPNIQIQIEKLRLCEVGVWTELEDSGEGRQSECFEICAYYQ